MRDMDALAQSDDDVLPSHDIAKLVKGQHSVSVLVPFSEHRLQTLFDRALSLEKNFDD